MRHAVVASDLAVFRELAPDASLHVPPVSVTAWTDALRESLCNSTLRTTAARAAVEFPQRFGWQRAALETLDVLSHAAADGRRGPNRPR